MSLPKTYKHAVFKTQGGPLIIEEVPLKLPGNGEVLVKVEACGVCYSDVYAQNNVMGGGFPIVPGHEIIGYIVVIGEGVTKWQVGDRIGAGWHGGHDGVCGACNKGWYQMCDNQAINGVTRAGGYAEYTILRGEAGVRVPAHFDGPKYAPIMCAGLTVFNSIRNMAVAPGETVAVQGLGGLGHLAVQYAAKMGYRVVAISRDGSKAQFARDLGAHAYIDCSQGDAGMQLQKFGGAKLIIATAPAADMMPPLLQGLGVLGKLLFLSVPGDVSINTGVMLRYGLSVQAWPCGHATDSEESIAFSDLQKIDCIIEKFPLDKANEAFSKSVPCVGGRSVNVAYRIIDAMLKGDVRFRAVIVME